MSVEEFSFLESIRLESAVYDISLFTGMQYNIIQYNYICYCTPNNLQKCRLNHTTRLGSRKHIFRPQEKLRLYYSLSSIEFCSFLTR